MKYMELSKENLEFETKKLWKKTEESFAPDAVLFVAKGAFYIGRSASDYFRAPLFEVTASRKKGAIKKAAAPLLRFMPKFMKRFLRNLEAVSGIHKKASGRNVKIENEKIYSSGKILLVDDSADTGATLLSVLELFKGKPAEVKTAVLNVMSASRENIAADYYLFEDTMISGPWSGDSPENPEFLKDYERWKESYG